MDKIKIQGGVPLNGTIPISGAKNAALPIIAAALLCPEEVEISNIPELADITSMKTLLEQLGATTKIEGEFDQVRGSLDRKILINATDVNSTTAPYDLVRKMRASVLVLGPLLARFGEAKVSLPGGCAIGTRPVDLHIKAMEALGAEIKIEDGYIVAKAPNGGLVGADIEFEKVSVGATENALMAAVLAKGTTTIKNAALEPEIVDLAVFLNAMGAKISGHGTANITIEGVKELHGARHQLIGDRIEAGTFAVAAAITQGDLKLTNINPELLGVVLELLKNCGVNVEVGDGCIRISNSRNCVNALNIETAPYPKFPTDMQAQMMALFTMANGDSQILESIFENRFMHAPELARMGAEISIEGNKAIVHGVGVLKGAEVMATDLRASVSLVLAALAAQGESIINRVYHLDRGYEHIESKLRACGAQIQRVN